MQNCSLKELPKFYKRSTKNVFLKSDILTNQIELILEYFPFFVKHF